MAVGAKREGHVEGFREELAGRAGAAFFTFFDDAEGTDAAFVRGAWDFSYHIASPLVGHLQTPQDRTALEIGYGGGRILAAAARHFRHVTGVDIHCQADLVRAELAARGVGNATLLTGDGGTLPIAGGSVDLVYSFIVLQHMERVEMVRRNIAEAARVLKPGGLALLYMARVSTFALYRRSAVLAALDEAIEHLGLCPETREVPARVNEINVRMSCRAMARAYRHCGLRLIGTGFSRRRIPDGGLSYGGQRYYLGLKG